ncbi:MAG: hypothetical protein UGF89_12670 [Acutalibacteraceae bacterium]|nr:hypothetical protein [Acutalibacteraceae bacterium]
MEHKHEIFGDYVLTAVPNAFNKKTSWWLSKKDCTVAMYCFTTEGSERQQINESKYQLGCIQTYIRSYEVRFGHKQDVEKKESPYMIKTNIGEVPISDYCDMMAMQNGYDSYADMRSHGVRLGGGIDEKYAVYKFEKKILINLVAQGFDTSKIVLNVQDFIDEEHKRCIWYGGVVATVEYKDHVFWLEAHGDVSITSYSEENSDEVEFYYSNKNNTGAYHNDEALAYFVNDARFDELSQAERLVWGNNNWFEILIEAPDGVKSDFGLDGVCDSDFLDECIEEMILTMDDMLNDISFNKSYTTTTLTLERAKILLYNALDVASGFYQDTEIEDLKKSIGITDAELEEIGFGEEDYE